MSSITLFFLEKKKQQTSKYAYFFQILLLVADVELGALFPVRFVHVLAYCLTSLLTCFIQLEI